MIRGLLALVLATGLVGAPVLAAEKEGGEPQGSLRRANEQATEATRGTAGKVGRAASRANERATEVTRGTAKEVGKAAQDAADEVGKAFRDLGTRLSK